MDNILINIGKDSDALSLCHRLSKDKYHLLGVLCTNDSSQYQKLKENLPEDTALACGTSSAMLEPRTKENTESFPSDQRAWDLYKQIASTHNDIVILSMGSLTNLAICFMRFPELRNNIKKILILGGSAKSGDVTPFAEKSIHDDPYAAKVIFESGVPIQMLGIDITEDYLQKDQLLFELLDAPENFTFQLCHVGIECHSPKTIGMTVCDLFGKSEKDKNVELVRKYHGGQTA